VRAVQVHLAVRKRTGDVDSRKRAIAFTHARDVGNSEAAIQFRYVQNCIHIAFAEKSENNSRPAAPYNSNCKPKTNLQTESYVIRDIYSWRISSLLSLQLASIWQMTEHLQSSPE